MAKLAGGQFETCMWLQLYWFEEWELVALQILYLTPMQVSCLPPWSLKLCDPYSLATCTVTFQIASPSADFAIDCHTLRGCRWATRCDITPIEFVSSCNWLWYVVWGLASLNHYTVTTRRRQLWKMKRMGSRDKISCSKSANTEQEETDQDQHAKSGHEGVEKVMIL